MLRIRWVALLLVAVAATAVLSACGSSDSDSSSSSSAGGGEETGGSASTDLAPFEKLVDEKLAPITKWPATAPTESVKKVDPNKLVVDIALSPEEPASLATAEGVVEAAKAIGWDSKILFGEFSAAKTAAAFEQAIALGADAVVTQGITPDQYTNSIKKLHESGAILVTTYSDFPVSDEYAQAEVSEHSKESGEIIGAKMAVDAGGEGQYALFNFPEYTVLTNRMTAAQAKLEECSGCEVLPIIDTASAEAEKTLPTATSTLLQKNPDLTAFATGIDTFVTAYQLPTVRQQGSEAGVYTFLGGKPTMEAIQKDEIKAMVVDPLVWGGWEAIDSIARLFAGQEPGGNGLPQRLLDESNIQEALDSAAPNGFWDADGFDYKGEYEKMWGTK
jgi:ribose transport system substrate-binding protein